MNIDRMLRPEADASTDVALDHYCPHCKTVATATVHATGHGMPGYLSTQEEARVQAQQNAAIWAATTMKLARCPGCGRRDEDEVRKQLYGSLIVGLLGGAATAATMFFCGGAVALQGLPLWVLTALAGCVGLSFFLGRFWLKLRASNRIKFEAPVASSETKPSIS